MVSFFFSLANEPFHPCTQHCAKARAPQLLHTEREAHSVRTASQQSSADRSPGRQVRVQLSTWGHEVMRLHCWESECFPDEAAFDLLWLPLSRCCVSEIGAQPAEIQNSKTMWTDSDATRAREMYLIRFRSMKTPQPFRIKPLLVVGLCNNLPCSLALFLWLSHLVSWQIRQTWPQLLSLLLFLIGSLKFQVKFTQ